jgi:hypothetical protein
LRKCCKINYQKNITQRKRDNIKRDNIKMDLREIGLEGVDWIHMAQNRDQWWALV